MADGMAGRIQNSMPDGVGRRARRTIFPTLTIRDAEYSTAELQRWKDGRYSLVRSCAPALANVLRRKAEVRPGRRFFGEAKVAATTPHEVGWYGSYKWLTSPRWCGSRQLANRYAAEFRDALLQHFPALCEFQQVARASIATGRDRKPVAPDLWLISPGEHRFIEVKLPGDRLGQHQLVGLALIAMYLGGDRSVSVEVVNLSTDSKPQRDEGVQQEFQRICRKLRQLRRGGPTHSS